MFTVECFCCPDGITPNSGLTGPNNTYTNPSTRAGCDTRLIFMQSLKPCRLFNAKSIFIQINSSISNSSVYFKSAV